MLCAPGSWCRFQHVGGDAQKALFSRNSGPSVELVGFGQDHSWCCLGEEEMILKRWHLRVTQAPAHGWDSGCLAGGWRGFAVPRAECLRASPSMGHGEDVEASEFTRENLGVGTFPWEQRRRKPLECLAAVLVVC